MMQEVLSKTTDANIPLQEQEYFELRLDDLGFPFRPLWVESIGIVVQHRFLIRQAHGAWSEVDRNIMWEGYDLDECSTLEEAQRYYELRRFSNQGQGIHLFGHRLLGCLAWMCQKHVIGDSVVIEQLVDRMLTCVDCQKEFSFTVDEQYFFLEKRFLNAPRHCLSCRAKRPMHSVKHHPCTDTICAECGQPTTVPFLPVRGTPVFCRVCFSKRRQNPDSLQK
jgi:CxxC-x17-CxxC domain-containing protein